MVVLLWRFWRKSHHIICLNRTFGHFEAKVSDKEGSSVSAEARLYVDRISGDCRGAQLRLVSGEYDDDRHHHQYIAENA